MESNVGTATDSSSPGWLVPGGAGADSSDFVVCVRGRSRRIVAVDGASRRVVAVTGGSRRVVSVDGAAERCND